MSEGGSAIEEITGIEAGNALDDLNGRETPAVLRGLCADWPLVRAAGDRSEVERLLRDHYEGAPVTAFLGGPESGGRIFYNDDISALDFDQVRMRLDEVLERIREAEAASPPPTVYMGSMALDHCLPGMKPAHALTSDEFPASVRIWIGNRTRVAAHHDVLDNVACVCVGRRRFRLFPPERLADLYLGPIDLTPAGQQVSLVDPGSPDLDRFPRYARALEASLVAELEPGDAIYIPSMWWHQVHALSPLNILINHWWRDLPRWMGAPGDVLMHALMNLRGLPKRQREAWRALFDHYVFDPPDDALDHIPPGSRGALGGMDADEVRRWRQILRNNLNR